MKNEEEEDVDLAERELERLQELAKISSICHRKLTKFERNTNLSHVVHAILNIAQFVCVLANELFHHIHHAINRKMREKEPTVPYLPEERNPIFFAYPICMISSLILSIMWLRYKNFPRLIDMALVGSAVGIVLMLLSGIFAMRHAEIYINLDEVTDEELLTHPIFIHNFIICVISILAMQIYLLHFWILYDCLQSRKKKKATEDAENSTSNSSNGENSQEMAGTSKLNEINSETFSDLIPVPAWEVLKRKLSEAEQADLENEPMILYCCCVDCWKYFAERDRRVPAHEFQVVHVV